MQRLTRCCRLMDMCLGVCVIGLVSSNSARGMYLCRPAAICVSAQLRTHSVSLSLSLTVKKF